MRTNLRKSEMPKPKVSRLVPSVVVDLRIPGRWANLRDLIARLPKGCRVTPRTLILPGGARIDLGFMRPDDEFPKVFQCSCRMPPSKEELAAVKGYTVNATLSLNGGSIAAARTIMEAAAVLVRAGGAGVFIDNSILAHGGEFWLEMTDDGGTDALSCAFVNIIKGRTDVWTVGMHIFGLRDIVLSREEVEAGFDIAEVVCYLVRGEKPVADGHFLASQSKGPWFACCAESGEWGRPGSPVCNPFGRFRLVKRENAASIH